MGSRRPGGSNVTREKAANPSNAATKGISTRLRRATPRQATNPDEESGQVDVN
jgi:hypothetical protein